MSSVLVLLQLAGYLGILWGSYALLNASPSSAGARDTATPEDPRPDGAGGSDDDDEVWCPRCGHAGCGYCRPQGF